jgi:D-alanyl-lipoteichoic acid acyltransferase DltB (MBOAT superfamily)
MLFTSLNFLVFFSLITVIHYLLPDRFRWVLLLAASLIFYLFATPINIIVLIASILLNYFLGIGIDHYDQDKRRKQVMIAGIIVNLLLLAVFRYPGSLLQIFPRLSHIPQAGDPLITGVIVPLGISFFTFTNISYLIEIKRRRIPAEKHLGYFATYLSFFPKLIQGPIERPQHFLPQLREKKYFDYNRVISGIRLMLWGFFKKLVIADQLSGAVNAVYDNKLNWHGPLLVVATVLYAFQIYMDFSGYIDIARGAARVLGFNLTRNFNNPYLSRSIKEFWSRWHITLSNFLRDYIFLPLAYYFSSGMKKEKYAGISTETYIYSVAITATFLLCGLWHGVGWNFIAWGGLYAVYLVIGALTEKPKKRFYRKTGLIAYKKTFNTIQVGITFLLVCFAWIFFRSADLHTSLHIVRNLFSGWGHEQLIESLRSLESIVGQIGLTIPEALVLLMLIPCIIYIEHYLLHPASVLKFSGLPLPVRWGAYYLLVLLICYFGKTDTHTFVYFQF